MLPLINKTSPSGTQQSCNSLCTRAIPWTRDISNNIRLSNKAKIGLISAGAVTFALLVLILIYFLLKTRWRCCISLSRPQPKPQVERRLIPNLIVKNYVSSLASHTLVLHDCYTDDTVYTLRSKLVAIVGVPPEDLRLAYAGKQLEDGQILFDCGVKTESTISLIRRVRGGGPIS